ncbi:hypothetical protein LEP1GSC202_3722 [Leptospira yanagawae serovar Saopaulo str. Sao Paulo = ATCC 700523]|uniref:Uncharacterized protein n=1 Tax=Leptospira yanagawae serovar Saopaulo str. Sao Paulo = ATCC 700523 TaxID=1249483 RepID=A0A5E8HGJ4_9LEPT|nr:hypothetical protein LEP1GSC202_3722 [Leptospira yanagawae serovar Saopaulo str. Sao Paulo = ATCC 700523]
MLIELIYERAFRSNLSFRKGFPLQSLARGGICSLGYEKK